MTAGRSSVSADWSAFAFGQVGAFATANTGKGLER